MGIDAADKGTVKWTFVMCLIAQFLSTLSTPWVEGARFFVSLPPPSLKQGWREGGP